MEIKKYDISKIPIMPVGKYKGKRVDVLPMSYLRWLLTQKFPPELLEYARKKISANPTTKIDMDVTRHAYDSFSKRYISWWEKYNHGLTDDLKIGIGTFIAEVASRAWVDGKNVSKKRHQDEEIIKEYQGVKFVFSRDGDLRVLITVM